MAQRRQRRGIALIMVLILIVMISLGAYSFTSLMTAQERATVMMGRRTQAQAAVASGVEYLKDYLVMTPEDQLALGGHFDNANYFSDVFVTAEGEQNPMRFAIVSMALDQYGEPQGLRYGLEDVGSKLNINELASAERYTGSSSASGVSSNGGEEAPPEEEEEEEGGPGGPGGPPEGEEEEGPPEESAPPEEEAPSEDVADGEDPFASPQRDVLMQLPLMTEQIADAILDWIDKDDMPRDFGVEGDGYTFVEPSNGPIASLDELLLVQGVTEELLYGADRNHNGIIDASEQEGATLLADANGSMARGWSAYLTVTSKDVLPQVEEPVDINQNDLELLYEELIAAGFDADFATYVAAYRQSGPFAMPEPPEDPDAEYNPPIPEEVDGREVDLTKSGGTKIESVLDLLGSMVQVTFAGEEEPVVVMSPYGENINLGDVLPSLMGGLSAGENEGTGRINLNMCTGPVAYGLAEGISEIDPILIPNILGAQDPGQTSGDVNYLFPTWPLAQGLVTVDEMKALLPFVSGPGMVYRAQIIGYSDVPGAFARAEVVIDASDGTPTVVSWRDLTHLGPGFDLETLSQDQGAVPQP